MPYWQRRYCWRSSDIKQLVDDLNTVAKAEPGLTHYAGTLLTFRDSSSETGVLRCVRVVDGQQRLTTVSILLACLAEKLDRDGQSSEWTAEIIRERHLTNPRMPLEKQFKLRLQSGDHDEYCNGINGEPKGFSAVTQAWKCVRTLVQHNDTTHLLSGLQRLRVVNIVLDHLDDPQQIFESLNATGRPLQESEKIKNWLLMDLPEETQRELINRYWRKIEQVLHAEYKTKPVDMFFHDLMRWKTGETRGDDKTYEQFRRWALQNYEGAKERHILFEELLRVAKLYGVLLGEARHSDRRVDAEIRHLREMGVHAHRPLTLRLLDEASSNGITQISNDDLRKIIAGISTWVTRLKLTGRPTEGMNKVIAEFAFKKCELRAEEDYVEYWLRKIRGLRNRSFGIPSDEEVREGIRTRKAYGSSITAKTKAILCELMEVEQTGEAPARVRLTVEHIMPRKLTREWKRELGEEAENIHEQYCDRFANLTLIGDYSNSGLGAKSFFEKRKIYKNSSVFMTRQIAKLNEWNKNVMLHKADSLATQILARWHWTDNQNRANQSVEFKWRIEGGKWHEEKVSSQMILNIVGALLSLNSKHIDCLRGDGKTNNIHPVSLYPPTTSVGSGAMRTVPGHDEWTFYPYVEKKNIVERCQKLGDRCGVRIQVEHLSVKYNLRKYFWKFLKDEADIIPGLETISEKSTQWINTNSIYGDQIGISIRSDEKISLCIRSGAVNKSESTTRMLRFSWQIKNQMADQEPLGDLESESEKGRSIRVEHSWTQDNRDEWLDTCQWITEQFKRLCSLISEENYRW